MISMKKIEVLYERNQLLFLLFPSLKNVFSVCGGRAGLEQMLSFYQKDFKKDKIKEFKMFY